MKKRATILYRTLSIYPLYKSFLLRVAVLLFSVACFYHYSENPVVITIAELFFFYAFLIIGDNELVIYSDSLKYSSNSIKQLFLNRKQFYYFKDIKSFKVSGYFGLKMDMFSDGAPIVLLDAHNLIEITLSDGKEVKIGNRIYIDNLRKA